MEGFLYKTLVEGKQEAGILILLLWILPLVAYAVDFRTGLNAAKVAKERIYSGGFRRTFSKISSYWSVQLMAVLIDIVGGFIPFYNLPYLSMIATVAIIWIEWLSVKENLIKMKADGAIAALGLTEKIIAELVTAKSKEDAIKSLTKTINEHEHKKEEKL